MYERNQDFFNSSVKLKYNKIYVILYYFVCWFFFLIFKIQISAKKTADNHWSLLNDKCEIQQQIRQCPIKMQTLESAVNESPSCEVGIMQNYVLT